LVGPFKKAKGGFTHIFVAVDKFKKWIDVKPTMSITTAKAMKFIKEIMHRFGVHNNIKINYASVSRPQSNSQVEHLNGMNLQGLKPRVFDRLKPYAGKWGKELPSVLWALRTTPSHATGHMSFFLVYRSEAMLPTEVDHKSFRVQHLSEE
jgi:hypothetical protein